MIAKRLTPSLKQHSSMEGTYPPSIIPSTIWYFSQAFFSDKPQNSIIQFTCIYSASFLFRLTREHDLISEKVPNPQSLPPHIQWFNVLKSTDKFKGEPTCTLPCTTFIFSLAEYQIVQENKYKRRYQQILCLLIFTQDAVCLVHITSI